VNASHQLSPDLQLNLIAGYGNDSFQGITRTDNVYAAAADVRYLVSRNLFLGGSFAYYQRSSAGGPPYTQNIVTLRIGTQF
jgi:uncharacterized protein (PEP-CTERM system associated)